MTRDAIDGPNARVRILARARFSLSRFSLSRFARSCDERARIGCWMHHNSFAFARREAGRWTGARTRTRTLARREDERTDGRTDERSMRCEGSVYLFYASIECRRIGVSRVTRRRFPIRRSPSPSPSPSRNRLGLGRRRRLGRDRWSRNDDSSLREPTRARSPRPVGGDVDDRRRETRRARLRLRLRLRLRPRLNR